MPSLEALAGPWNKDDDLFNFFDNDGGWDVDDAASHPATQNVEEVVNPPPRTTLMQTPRTLVYSSTSKNTSSTVKKSTLRKVASSKMPTYHAASCMNFI